jgi:DNA-binding beta-propeller fold protein YncE
MTTLTQPDLQDILRTEQGGQAAVRRLARIPLAPPVANARVAFRPAGVACGKDRVYVTIIATAPDASGVQRETPAGHVAVIDEATQTVHAYIPVANAPRYAAVDATTQRVFVTHNNAAGNVAVIDGPSGRPVGELLKLGGNLGGVAVNPTTRRVYVVRGNQIIVLDADNPHVPLPSREITLETGIAVDRIAVDSATNRVFVPAKHAADHATTHRLYVIDGSANIWTKVTYEHQLLANSQPRDVAVDPLHKRIYVSNFGNTNSLSVLDLTGLTLLSAAKVPGALAADVAVDPLMSLVYVTTSV